MATSSIWPEVFDPSWEFEASRPVTISGRSYQRGERIEKDGVRVRVLRLLYDARHIKPMDPEKALELRAPKPSKTLRRRRPRSTMDSVTSRRPQLAK